MKKILLMIIYLLVFSCNNIKNTNEEIINIVQSIAKYQEVSSSTAKAVFLGDIYYFYEIRVYGFDIYYTGSYSEPVYAVVDTNHNIKLFKNNHNVLEPIKKAVKYEYVKKGTRIYFIDQLITNIMDIVYPSENIIYQNEDINGLQAEDYNKLKNVQILPLKRFEREKSLEVEFYTWSIFERDLIKNKIIISDSLNWQREILIEDLGATPSDSYRL